MRVFKLNETDWAFGDTFGQAIDAYCLELSIDFDEALDDPSEIDGEELDRLNFCDDNGQPVRTFREELYIRMKSGDKAGFFASSEY